MSNNLICAAAFSALLIAPSAAAQTADHPLSARFETCLAITSDSERLSCLEKASRAFLDASRRQDVVVMSREDVRSTRRSLFGFQLPRVALFGRGDTAMEESEVTTEIGSVTSPGYGKYVIVLRDGARWTTTEAWPGGQVPRAGQSITIRKGSLGGYFLKLGNGRAVRGIRTG